MIYQFLLIAISSLGLIPSTAFGWICDEASSTRQGSTISACGVGSGIDESEARSKAFENAAKEFAALCNQSSSDCKGHKTIAEPKRTTCNQTPDKTFKCTRMIEYRITGEMEQAPPVSTVEVAPVFSYDQISGHPKITKGMTLEKVLAQFGKPAFTQKVDEVYTIINYTDPTYCDQRCTVGLRNGQVYKYNGWKTEFTDDLKTKSWWERLTNRDE